MFVFSKIIFVIILLITPTISTITTKYEIINNKCKNQSLYKINNQRLFNCVINDFDNCHYIENYNDYIKIKNKCIQNNYIYEYISRAIIIYNYLY
jgi:hypothetical protein